MLKLEVFETHSSTDAPSYLDARSAEKLRDAAYEQGYAAGWQDALDQMRNDDALARAATLDALQSISFTYAEARAMSDSQLGELVTDLLTKIVPDACLLSLPGRVAQELRVLLARDATASVQVRCAPQSVAVLAPILTELPAGAQVTLTEEPSFSAAQVVLQGQDQQREIDLSSVAALLQAGLANAGHAATQKSLLLRGAQHG